MDVACMGMGNGRGRTLRRPRGFTLIELMVVVAIVAILAAIAYPSYQDQVRKSRRGQAKVDLVELAQRAERYHSVNNTYVGFWATVPAGHQRSPREGTVVHYDIDLDGETATAFELTAVPQGKQAEDKKCMTLTLNAAGQKGIDGGTDSAANCW